MNCLRRWVLGLILGLSLTLLAPSTPADPPSTSEPSRLSASATQNAERKGHLAGMLHAVSPITRLVAIDRGWADPVVMAQQTPTGKGIYPGTWNPESGAFDVPGLLPGHSYDLVAWTQDGRWEGVDMAYHRVVTPGPPVTEEDKKWLREFVANEKQFTNRNRVLWMAADHQHATLLVELIRDTDFHSGAAGEVVYRVELWYFENNFGGWAKDRNTEKVMVRWRGQAERFPGTWQYVPQLGGIEAPAAAGTPLRLTLPEKADPKHGRIGGLAEKTPTP